MNLGHYAEWNKLVTKDKYFMIHSCEASRALTFTGTERWWVPGAGGGGGEGLSYGASFSFAR